MSDEKLTDSSSIGVDSDEGYLLPCPKISFNHDIFNTLQQYEEELKKSLDSLGQSPHSSESSKVASNINSILSFDDSKTEFSKTESRDNLNSTGGSLDKRFISSDQDHKSYEYEYISYYDEEDNNEPEVEIGGKEKIPTEVKKFANYNFMNTLTSVDDDKVENEKSQESSTLPDGMGVAEGSIVRGNTKADKITTSDILSDISDSPVEHVQLKHLSDEGDGKNQNSGHTSEENTPDLAILGAELTESDKNGSDNDNGDENSFNSTKASLDKPINKNSPNEKVSDSPSKGNSILSSSFGSPLKQESTFVSHTLEDIPEEPEDDFISPKTSEVISGLIDGKSTDEDSNMGLEKNQSGTFNSFVSIKNLKSVPNSIISADFVSELNESKNDDKDSILSSFTSAAQSPNKVENPGDSDFNSTISKKNEIVSEFNQTISSINDKNKTFDSEDFDDSISNGSNKSSKKSRQSSDFISEIKSEEKSFGSSSFISTTKSTKNGKENSLSEIHSGIAINEESDDFISEPKLSKVISEGGSSDFISFSKSSIAHHANSDSGFVSFISSKSSKKIKQDGSSDFISTIKSEKNAVSSSEFITEDTFESKSASGNSDFISVISTERKKEDSDDDFVSIKSDKEISSNDFVSTIKSEKEQVSSSSGFITTISSEKKEKSESDDFVSTIKSEKQPSDDSNDFVSMMTSNRDDSSDFISTMKSEEQKVSESDDFVSTIKEEHSKKSESSAYISFVKSEKTSTADSDDFISTIKSEKKSTNSSDFVSTIKSENKSNDSDDFISTIKSEKQQSDSDDFISTIKSEKKSDTESSEALIMTIKSEKQSAVTSSEFISVLSSEKKNVSESSELISTFTTKEISEKDSDSDDFVSTIKSEIHKDSAIDEFISTIKSEKVVESSSDEFISTIKSKHSVESSDDFVETLSEIQSQKETSDDFDSTIKSVHEKVDKRSVKSENDSLPDDFISTIKSVETAKTDAESSVTSIKSVPSENSQRTRRRKRRSSSSVSKSQVSINRKSEASEKSIDDDFISTSKVTVQSPEKQAENDSSDNDNDNFIFQSPAPKQAKSRLNPEKITKDDKSAKEEKPVKSDNAGELGNLQNLAANLQASNLSNETVMQLITTLSKIADQNKNNQDHHHHRHRHHHHRSLNTDEIPCIPAAFKKYSSASNTDQYSSAPEMIPTKRSRTKLSLSVPHDTNDFLDLEEISPTNISASDIPQNDEIPKPTFISFKEDEKDKKIQLSLSTTKQIGDIPPQIQRSPLKVSQNTMNPSSIKLSPIKSKQTPTITRFSASQYTTSAYPSYGAYPIDENFISTIRTARVQLASIQNSISISRQKRAMHESRVSSFKYTKNPFNE